MADHDSDSSGDGPAFATTNVLLGYASKEPTEDSVSQMGGQPSWLDESDPPSASLARCKICNTVMVLLLQLNGELPEVFPGHERRLYIFACRRKTCNRKEGSVAAFRSIRVSRTTRAKENAATKPVEEQRSIPLLGEALFGQKAATATTGSNPFAARPASSTNPPVWSPASGPPSALAQKPPLPSSPQVSMDLPTSFADKVRLSDPSGAETQARPFEPWPSESVFSPYPPYFLDAELESLEEETQPAVPLPRVSLDEVEGAHTNGGKEDAEIFESSLDHTFQHFADRLSQNPLQVLRYEFRGQPLLYSKVDTVGKMLSSHHGHLDRGKALASQHGSLRIPRCGNCGAARTFELQLTPHMITELEEEEEGLDGMEWGTIVLGVCENDCQARAAVDGKVSHLEEWVGVQWEETRK